MLVLIGIGFLAGLITSLSPCVLPVLPIILAAGTSGTAAPPAEASADGVTRAAVRVAVRAGSASAPSSAPTPARPVPPRSASGRPRYTLPAATARPRRLRVKSWRPYGVVAGLVLSFSLSTLFGTIVLSSLGLPLDFLRDAGIVVLVVVGLGLLIRPIGDLLERPFVRLTGRPVNPNSSGLVVGLGAGLLFVPCAGPVLTAITVVGSTHRVGFSALVLTFAFGVGVGVPLLLLAMAGDALSRRASALRQHAVGLRMVGGAAMIVIAALIGFNLTDGLQRHVPGYTTALQNSIEGNKTASKQLQALSAAHHSQQAGATPSSGSGSGSGLDASSGCSEGGSTPQSCGPAPEFTGINAWLNTPGNQPLTLAGLRGKVVLIDFWTYSCINCQRTLPHVEAWYRSYEADGLVVVGVHTPEFAFEHVESNVAAQARALGVKYPIAIDNDYATWEAYSNNYWPAEYLVDASGVIRHVQFGEGDYSGTESVIRQLLTAANPALVLPAATDIADTTPTEQQTPETYLGYQYQLRYSGDVPAQDQNKAYKFPATLQPDTFALSGTWDDGMQALTAGANAKLELSFQANVVYLVIGGTGTVGVAVDGVTTSTIQVSGVPKLYTITKDPTDTRHTLTLSASPGVQAYDFTFG
jgi:cytochrome c biogenesis protein CcdA/thiol-disulfide isomerase/thioredoxin